MSYYTFTFLGYTLTDPNLFLTDMLITGVALFCYQQLRNKTSEQYAISSFRKFFLFTALSTFIAGLGHLTTYYTDQYLKSFAWIFSLFANFYIAQSCINFIVEENKKSILAIFLKAKFILAFIFLFITLKFYIITIDTTLSIGLITLPFCYIQWKKTGNDGLKWICLGIVFTMLTAIVGLFKLSISDIWFNDKDINHLIICGSLLLMYKGMKKL